MECILAMNLSKRLFAALVLFSFLLGGCAGFRKKKTKSTETVTGKRQTAQQQSGKIAQLKDRIETMDGKIQSLNNRIEKKNRTIEDLREKLRNRDEELEKLRNRLEARQEELRQARNQIESLREMRDRKSKRIQELEDKLASLRSQKEDQLERLREENRELAQELEDIDETTIKTEGQNVVISMDSRLLFDLGDWRLKKKSKDTLDQIANKLRDYPNRPIMVEGHTDTVPVKPGTWYRTNWHLSAARSVSVVQYLTDNHNLLPNRFMATGFGEHQPVRPNTSPENRQQNRRVEIVIFAPELSEKFIQPNSLSGS